MSDLLVFLNPLAGGGRAPALWARLCRRVPELGAARLVASDDALSVGQFLLGQAGVVGQRQTRLQPELGLPMRVGYMDLRSRLFA